MKKAQGMSLNVIIVAVIVLIVLVVLVLIFSGKLKIFGSKTSETTSQYSTERCQVPGTGNTCVDSKEACDELGGAFMERGDGWSDCTSAGQCCYV